MTGKLKSLTPVIIVDEIEPCVEFWMARLGWEKPQEVPGEGGKLAFAILQKDGLELMYQTKASVAADSPNQKGELTGHTTALFFTVESMADLDAIEAAVQGAPMVKERHKTFYGSTEFYIREPGGNVVGFAAF